MNKLAEKVAIVTGAGRGLGRAYALRLAALGAKVAVADLNLKSYVEFEAEAKTMTADTTVDEIRTMGVDARGYEFDVANRNAVFEMVDDVMKAWGRVDILVANAGGGAGQLNETTATLVSEDLLRQVTDRNFFGTVHSCSAVAPVMKKQQSGKIVTVASFAGRAAVAGGIYAHYAANKAAIIHYTRYLAQELGAFNVNANCIAPGFIRTGRIVELMGEKAEKNEPLQGVALRRDGTTEDCANVIEFLCTDLSGYVTGAVIPVDGGLVA